MTVAELMIKLLNIRISPNTRIFVTRENEPMLEVHDIQIVNTYDTGEEILTIIPKYNKGEQKCML